MPSHPYEIKPDPDPLGATEAAAISVPAKMMVRSVTGNLVQWWDLNTRTYIGSVSGIDIENGFTTIDVDNAGTAYFFGYYTVGLSSIPALYAVTSAGSTIRTDSPGPLFAGPVRVFNLVSGVKTLVGTAGCVGWSTETGYVEDNVVVAHAQRAMDFCLQGNGEVAGLFEPVGASNKFTIKSITGAAYSYEITGSVARGDTDSNINSVTLCHVSSENHWLVITDGKFYLINDYNSGTPGTIKASGDFAELYYGVSLPRKDPTVTTFWAEFNLISCVTAAVDSSVDPLDWVDEDTYVGVQFDPISNALVSHPQIDQILVWRMLESDVPGGIGGVPQRAYTITQDDHDFYMLNLGDTTLAVDLQTEQWSTWRSDGLTFFRISDGLVWDYENVGGDYAEGLLWNIDPNERLDDGISGLVGDRVPIVSVIRGMYPLRLRNALGCFRAVLTCSQGSPSAAGVGISMRTSDDMTLTWTNHGFLTLDEAAKTYDISWVSMGLIIAPGRVFEITDTGYAMRIEALDIDLGSQEGNAGGAGNGQ